MIDFFNYVLNGFLQGQIYALLALGFMVIYRASKVFNFAQGELMMLGAYTVWTLTLGANLSPWLAIPLAFICAIAYGWLIERLFFERLVGESVFSMVMVTIGLVILIRGAVLVVWGPADRSFPTLLPPAPLIVGDMIFPSSLLFGAVLTLFATLGLSWFFNRTRAGLTLTAVAEEPTTAISLGISVKRAVTLAWMMGSVIATAGAIVLLSGRSLTVGTADVALAALPVALLAGLESIGGLIIAGAIVGIVQALVAAYVDPAIGGSASSIVPFVFMLFILLVRPTGLFGWRHVERV
ncbi:MAG: branched-chain amino acid ABC transporter permease [Hydrogenophaga sp.]|uniref:branched-chain amino acid ABC transporter permease n=1 Tax=Hydrogenophaga sp. TaxID=1904254 RepID=UPI002630998F|nr:branched-chain amino acid ABC transporter permease [Hydrogenophaga sp.]MDM7941414.1 branched-chain amino acid ABC transporter permease [Hydrogenophaga sp.]